MLVEVASNIGKAGESFLAPIADANKDANSEIMRSTLILARGTGKATVMAMIAMWHAIGADRHHMAKSSRGDFRW